jgi:hypothetical protein
MNSTLYALIIVGLAFLAGCLGYTLLARADRRARDRDIFAKQCELAAQKIGQLAAWAAITEEISEPRPGTGVPARPLARTDWNFFSLRYSDFLVIPVSLFFTLPLFLQHRLNRVIHQVAEYFPAHSAGGMNYCVTARDPKTNHFIKAGK